MAREKCPKCDYWMVADRGSVSAPYMIAGSYPGFEEIKQGYAMVGQMSQLLNIELARVGLVYQQFLFTNLWLHQYPAEKEKGREKIIENHNPFFIEEFYKKTKNKKAILIAGSECVRTLTGHKVEDVTGLDVRDLLIVPLKVPVIASVNPASAFHSVIGEVRISLQHLKDVIG